MNESILKLLAEYKETEQCLEKGINWLDNSDYAQGKLDLVKIIISDLEKLIQK